MDIKFDKIWTVSNGLSFLRIFISIPIWILLDNYPDAGARYAAAAISIFAAVTDILDGWAARKMNQVTELGKMLDPVADKISIGVVSLKLYLIGVMDPFIFFAIVGRDVLILLLSIPLASKVKEVTPSNIIGKATAVLIGIYILTLYFMLPQESIWYKLIYWGSIVMIIVSFTYYTIIGIKKMKESEDGSVQKS